VINITGPPSREAFFTSRIVLSSIASSVRCFVLGSWDLLWIPLLDRESIRVLGQIVSSQSNIIAARRSDLPEWESAG